MNIIKTPENSFQKDIDNLLKEGILAGVFPGAAAGISLGLGKKRKKFVSIYGNAAFYPETRILEKDNFFDLASLTKPLATAMAVLCLMKEKKISINESLSSLLEKNIKGEKNKITTRNLLSHSSGLPAYKEYFKILQTIPFKERSKEIENIILQEKLIYKPGKKAIYSDLGFILLGRIIENKSGRNLAEYVEDKVLKPWNLNRKIFYNPLNQPGNSFKRNNFVATEKCPWRKKTLCGEVHDDNCYSLGGVAGHSGLFGDISSVISYTAKILEMWKGKQKHPNITEKDLNSFLIKQHDINHSSWALGFDTPASKDSSSGRFFSPESVGHLGYTGTSFWIDPEKKLIIVLLTNRVHPTRENQKIKEFRPYFHDSIVKKLFSRSA